MKILVFAHRLEVGGTQVNAIELAAALRDLHGQEVTFFATPGPMLSMVQEKGLRFLPAPDARFHPSPSRISALREVVRRERPTLLHVWDWWQCMEAYYGVHLPMRVPMVVTDMMMDLTRVLPKTVPTTFGTPKVLAQARSKGRQRTQLILPPVDIHLNAAGAVDSSQFRERYCKAGEITLVIASRLTSYLKGESLLNSIDAVRILSRQLPLRLVVVGDGPERPRLERLANQINSELGRPCIVLTGYMVDPRPAYAAADIVLGMGGSVLRGMAFGKPAIVIGEKTFSMPVTPETAKSFYYGGMYGEGDGSPTNARLVAHVRSLVERPEYRETLGCFSREFVQRYFSLETVSTRLVEFFHSASREVLPLHIEAYDGLRTAAVYLRERRFLTASRAPGAA